MLYQWSHLSEILYKNVAAKLWNNSKTDSQIFGQTMSHIKAKHLFLIGENGNWIYSFK